jgi:hypothetical protein
LVYGLRDARTPLIKELRDRDGRTDGPWIYTVDAINFLQLRYSELTEWAEDSLKEKTEALVREGDVAKSDTELVNRFMRHMFGNPVIRDWVDVKGGPEPVWLIKACQAAILIPGITIHFILDGIEDVVDPNSHYYGSFTSSELRFIYRYHLLCQQQSQALNVRFYHKGQIVPPPWTDATWAPVCPNPTSPLGLLDREVYYEDQDAYERAKPLPGDSQCHVVLTNGGQKPAVKRSESRLGSNSPGSKKPKLLDFRDDEIAR